MRIDHYLKDADQWRSHNPVWCRFVCTICVVEIGVDESIAVLTIAEHVAWCDPVIVEMFALRTDYHSLCHCDSRYVGRTSQRLQDRIKQHVPQWLRQQLTRPRRSQPHRSCKRTDTKPDCDSAIGQHLLDNDRCALNYDDKRFSILAAARNSFHHNLLEATYIKTRRPVLCRQKEFVYTLKLFR